MQTPPKHLVDGCPDTELEQIQAWWDSLGEADRERISKLCDERRESCFFGVLGEAPPKVEGGHFLPDKDTLDQVGLWDEDRFDYYLNHPELVIVWNAERRTFHIGCIAHAAARACWRKGHVPVDFVCPFGHADCLMNPMRGRSIAFQHLAG